MFYIMQTVSYSVGPTCRIIKGSVFIGDFVERGEGGTDWQVVNSL